MKDYSVKISISAVDKFSSQLKRLSGNLKNIERLQERIEHHSKALNALKAQAIGMVALGAAMALPVKEAINFESAMADVNKVVDFKDKANGLKAFSDQILRMGRALPISHEGLAQIAAAGGQLGIKETGLPEFVKLTAKVATAFDILPDEAGDSMAKLSNIFQVPILKVGELTDAVNHLSNNSFGKARQIINVLKRVGGTAKQFGLSPEKTAAISGTFLALGKRDDVAATALNAMLTKLQTASVQPKAFQKTLKAIKVDAKQLEQAIQKDALGALVGFLGKIEQLQPMKRAKALALLFGMEYQDDISSLVGSLGKLRQALKLVEDPKLYRGSAQKEFEARANTTANNIQLAINNFKEFSIIIGTQYLPSLNKALKKFNEFAGKLSDFLTKHQELTRKLAIGAAGFMAYKLGVLALKFAFHGVALKSLEAAKNVAAFNAAAKGGIAGGVAAAAGGASAATGSAASAGPTIGSAAIRGLVPLQQSGLAKLLSKLPGGAALLGMGGNIGKFMSKMGWAGRLGKGFLKGAGGPIGLGINGALLASAFASGNKSDIGGGIGGMVGAGVGGMAGAALGSVIPGAGTAVGGVLGSIGGSLLGDQLGRVLADHVTAADKKVGEAIKPRKDQLSMRVDVYDNRVSTSMQSFQSNKPVDFRAMMGPMMLPS